MDHKSHLDLFEIAIKRVYPDLKSETGLVLDDETGDEYFLDRKISYFRSTENFQTLDFKIKRFRNRFFITGYIDKVSLDHIVTRFNVKTGLKVSLKRKSIPELFDKVAEIRDNLNNLNIEIFKMRQEIAELKRFSAQGFGLSIPNSFATSYASCSYETPRQDESDYVAMTPRTQS